MDTIVDNLCRLRAAVTIEERREFRLYVFANSDFVIGAVNALTKLVTVMEKLTKTFGGFSVTALAVSFKLIADSAKKAAAAVPGLRAAQAAMEQAYHSGGPKAAADAIAMLSSRQQKAVITTSALTAAEQAQIEAELKGRVATDAFGNAIETAGAKAKLASSSAISTPALYLSMICV